MMGMGILGVALAGGMSGYGRGLAEIGQQQMAEESAMRRESTAAKLREQYRLEAEKRADERAEQKRQQTAGRVKGYIQSEEDKMWDKAQTTDEAPPSDGMLKRKARDAALLEGRTEEAGILDKVAGPTEYDQEMAQAKLDKAKREAQGKDKALKHVENGRGGIDWFDEQGNLIKSTKGGKTKEASSDDKEGGKPTADQRNATAAAEKLKRLRLKDTNGQTRPLAREEYAELASWTDKAAQDRGLLEEAPKWVRDTINQNGGVSAMQSLLKSASTAESYLQERSTNAPKSTGRPSVTKAQVDAAAKAKGITDPKELARFYTIYGVK